MLRTIAWILAVFVATIGAMPASALTFHFSFSRTPGTPLGDILGNIDGVVTGRIVGLADNSTGPASSVFIESVPADLSGQPFLSGNDATLWTDVVSNTFTVSGGEIVSGSFIANSIVAREFGIGEIDRLCLLSCTPISLGDGSTYIGFTNFLTSNLDSATNASSFTFVGNNGAADTTTNAIPPSIPLPASWLTLLGAVAVFRLIARNKEAS